MEDARLTEVTETPAFDSHYGTQIAIEEKRDKDKVLLFE